MPRPSSEIVQDVEVVGHRRVLVAELPAST